MFYDRRAARGSRRMPGRNKSLFKLVLALAAGRPVFTADYYAVDGVSGKVASFIDWNDASHTIAQSTAGNQVALPAAHADFANRLCATFVRANANRYLSNRAAASWAFGHSGAGVTSVCVSTSTSNTGNQAKYSTRPTTGIGFSQYRTTAGVTGFYVENAAAQVVINIAAGGVVANDVPTYTDISFTSPNYNARVKGTSYASGTQSNTPTSNAPGSPCALGSDTVNHCDMRWLFLWFGPELTAAGRTTMQQFILQNYGLAA